MKEINYKNKKLKLPYDLKDGFAAVIYDHVIRLNLKAERKDAATGQPPGISEHQDDWQKVRDGLNFFRQYFAKEYMVLLD